MKRLYLSHHELLDAVEARLERVSRATGGHGVEALWLDEAERSDPGAVPDALYINRGDPYVVTMLYDVRRDAFEDIGWGDWLEAAEAAAIASGRPPGPPGVRLRPTCGSLPRPCGPPALRSSSFLPPLLLRPRPRISPGGRA